jgi:hypothetical protein
MAPGRGHATAKLVDEIFWRHSVHRVFHIQRAFASPFWCKRVEVPVGPRP